MNIGMNLQNVVEIKLSDIRVHCENSERPFYTREVVFKDKDGTEVRVVAFTGGDNKDDLEVKI